MSSRPIRVLIVDDSAVVRRLVTAALRAEPDIEVVGTAVDPYVARDRIQELQPDVLTLDLEMPRMDGLTFLQILMAQRPMPVIVMSSLTKAGSDHALEALRLGAFDVLGKPAGTYSFGDLGPPLIARIRAAASARLRVGVSAAVRPPPGRAATRRIGPRDIILLGASTGGTEALRELLTALPDGLPGIAIVQHIPAMFSNAFAVRLNQLCAFAVREAVDGDRLEPGLALVAPGGFHLLLQWNTNHYRARVVNGPPVWHQRPAVDLLFKSMADGVAARHVVAGVLTGMGRDGADGLRRLRDGGATTFAQDEATSVVYGMPRAAWENGGAQRQLPLDRMAAYLTAHYTSAGCSAPVSP